MFKPATYHLRPGDWLPALLLLWSVAFAGLVYAEDAARHRDERTTRLPPNDISRVVELIALKHYLAPDEAEVKANTGNITHLNSYLKQLDPYSRYLTREEAEFFGQRTKKTRFGIGINLLLNHGKVLGIPLVGGPLYRKRGQTTALIQSINGHRIMMSNFDSYAFLGDLPHGKPVDVIFAARKGIPRQIFHIIPENVSNPSLEIMHHKDALILKINRFSNGDNKKVRMALRKLGRKQKLIIDLRFSPGGDIYAMNDLLSLLLPEGKVVATLLDNKGRTVRLRTLSGQVKPGRPVYIAVSEYTASSAELFARALSYYKKRALIVGEATKGKCLAQRAFKLPSGGLLSLSTHRILDASGKFCQGIPLNPDHNLHDIEFLGLPELYRNISGIGGKASQAAHPGV